MVVDDKITRRATGKEQRGRQDDDVCLGFGPRVNDKAIYTWSRMGRLFHIQNESGQAYARALQVKRPAKKRSHRLLHLFLFSVLATTTKHKL